MLKPSFRNILLYLFVKYLVFCLILAFRENRFKKLVVNNSQGAQDMATNSFYYVLYVMIFIVALMLVFSAPFYYAFKVKRPVFFALLISVILVVEYLLYTYLASPSDVMNGLYNGVISIIFLFVFFFKTLKEKF